MRPPVKVASFLRYILMPVAVFAVGVKAGVEYAKANYVSKDRKFIEGKIVKEKK